MSNITKGEWFVSEDYRNQIIVASKTSNKPMICILRDRSNDGEQKREEAIANAKLISAAPELLECLNELIKSPDVLIPFELTQKIYKTLNKAIRLEVEIFDNND
jgi:hypothetical protein